MTIRELFVRLGLKVNKEQFEHAEHSMERLAEGAAGTGAEKRGREDRVETREPFLAAKRTRERAVRVRARNVEEVERRGLPHRVLHDDNLALDLDTADDLQELDRRTNDSTNTETP